MFTKGAWNAIARLDPAHAARYAYDPADLPRTQAGNATLLKLPCFAQADEALVDQYARAFEKVLARADDLPRGQA
jgi:hypothetical protein